MLNKINNLRKEIKKANPEASAYAINFILKVMLAEKSEVKTFAGYEVVKETVKAVLIKVSDNNNVWLPKSALKKDGSLKKVFAEKVEIATIVAFIDLSNVVRETEKAVFVEVETDTEFYSTAKVWLPKKCIAGQNIASVSYDSVAWVFEKAGVDVKTF